MPESHGTALGDPGDTGDCPGDPGDTRASPAIPSTPWGLCGTFRGHWGHLPVTLGTRGCSLGTTWGQPLDPGAPLETLGTPRDTWGPWAASWGHQDVSQGHLWGSWGCSLGMPAPSPPSPEPLGTLRATGHLPLAAQGKHRVSPRQEDPECHRCPAGRGPPNASGWKPCGASLFGGVTSSWTTVAVPPPP